MLSVGPTSRAALESLDWFQLGYRATSYAGLEELETLQSHSGNFEVLIFFGDWCSDTQLQVPGLIKLLDQVGISPSAVHWIHLDQTKAFLPLTQTYKIEKVPTFIFMRNGSEIGRIVERPKINILEDSIRILKG